MRRQTGEGALEFPSANGPFLSAEMALSSDTHASEPGALALGDDDPGVEGVPHDGEQPGLQSCSRLELVDVGDGFEKSFLTSRQRPRRSGRRSGQRP